MPRPQITRAHPYTPRSGRFAGRTFHTEREYRNALAQAKGFRNWDAQRQAAVTTGSRLGLTRLRPAQLAKRDQAFHVLSLMRRFDLDLATGIRAYNRGNPTEHISREAALKYVGSALESRNGRLVARSHDRLLRVMRFPTATGVIDLEVKDSRSARRIGAYWNAVRVYLETGDEHRLHPFRGKSVRSGKRAYPFITDPATLKRLAYAGELRVDSIYEHFGSK